MASKERENRQRAAFMCPTCKNPVRSEIRRHKTLGIFVPVWRPGPCENPDCGEHAAEERPSPHRARPWPTS
ncbi:hypothetical protein ACFY9Q_15450 [Streptomyces sp. NPDC012389]|uniref:hypothetical protein n=1 Tax=unclassified Streptomyces TaxID=2593676 RepID=UPI00081ECDFE|nr:MULTISPECIES: hypothetical protein [unclassified Streptomyces]MYR94763.1 hypothetical protein [Streptomyces sp. SID4937]SCD77691.1 hypothetical protein GA0115243_104212 [Streptomyces sp. ScaeMP-e83]